MQPEYKKTNEFSYDGKESDKYKIDESALFPQSDAILLKIKRQFTNDEAVQSLLKMLSNSELEVGIMKSELAEAVDKAERIRQERTLTKKQWMQEEMFEFMNQEFERMKKAVKKHSDERKVWMNKYFSLLASTQNKTT